MDGSGSVGVPRAHSVTVDDRKTRWPLVMSEGDTCAALTGPVFKMYCIFEKLGEEKKAKT